MDEDGKRVPRNLETLKTYQKILFPEIDDLDQEKVTLIWKYVENSHYFTQCIVPDLVYCFKELYRNVVKFWNRIKILDTFNWNSVLEGGVSTSAFADASSQVVSSILDDVRQITRQTKSQSNLGKLDLWMILAENYQDIILEKYIMTNAKHHFGYLYEELVLEPISIPLEAVLEFGYSDGIVEIPLADGYSIGYDDSIPRTIPIASTLIAPVNHGSVPLWSVVPDSYQYSNGIYSMQITFLRGLDLVNDRHEYYFLDPDTSSTLGPQYFLPEVPLNKKFAILSMQNKEGERIDGGKFYIQSDNKDVSTRYHGTFLGFSTDVDINWFYQQLIATEGSDTFTIKWRIK